MSAERVHADDEAAVGPTFTEVGHSHGIRGLRKVVVVAAAVKLEGKRRSSHLLSVDSVDLAAAKGGRRGP
jgi:hypothetical protein